MSPLGDRVLLRAVEAKRETDGGVILASDNDVERPTLGEVRVGGGMVEQEPQKKRMKNNINSGEGDESRVLTPGAIFSSDGGRPADQTGPRHSL